MTILLLKCLVIAAGIGAWFWTQAWIARRPFPEGGLQDRVHDLTEPLNRWLLANPRHADVLLIVTSALIDVAAVWLLVSSVIGPSFGPFVGLLMLFVLRQACQGLCALPPPRGMIWRSPGVPSLLVTYGTATDLFFSGHTAIAVYAGLELAHRFGGWGIAAGAALALVEAATVLVLRAHYTMDVFAGAVTALWVWTVAQTLAPSVDALLASLGG
jgi:PAP2 superfamily C-terminal